MIGRAWHMSIPACNVTGSILKAKIMSGGGAGVGASMHHCSGRPFEHVGPPAERGQGNRCVGADEHSGGRRGLHSDLADGYFRPLPSRRQLPLPNAALDGVHNDLSVAHRQHAALSVYRGHALVEDRTITIMGHLRYRPVAESSD